MDCSRHNRLNHPFRENLNFNQTQLVEMVMWQVQYVKKQGTSLGLSYSSHSASKKLLTACQHWKHTITCLSAWPMYRCHSQLRQSCCPNLSVDRFSQPCSAGGKIAPGVYILLHKIIVNLWNYFLCLCGLKKKCTVMSFSCSLKVFGWRYNCSRSVYFASWSKIHTAWIVQKYQHRMLAMKNEKRRYWPKKNLSVKLCP